MDNTLILTITVAAYLLIIGFLGFYGYRQTKSNLDYLVAGRQMHPFIMALSYGSTFISTSAIVGFGGAAALFGMGLLWLTFLNIFVGILIAFVIFGKRTRHLGHNLDVHTFPELLGKRYQSNFIQNFGGFIIFIFMPLYAAAVLIGAARFLETTFSVNYNISLLIYTLIICAYVLAGGLKGVMYTDAFQGVIMLMGMAILLVFTYTQLGGITAAHQALTNLGAFVPEKLVKGGHLGWTSMPALGSNLWWNLVSTIVMGVGIGVLAQPQLAVRFMTVKSSKELNRGVGIGAFFILMMTGVAFTVGALSNAYFFNNPDPGFAGKVSLTVAQGNIDKIIPIFVNHALPKWFVIVFMMTLLAAAMSTSSSQFHTMGTALGKDIVEKIFFKGKHSPYTILMTRMGIILGVLATVFLGYRLPDSIIAIATAIFFGLCASAFLPTYVGALFWKGMTKAGAIASMAVGSLGTVFWLLFIHEKESAALGLCKLLFNKPTLAKGSWTVVDQIFIILPLSFLVGWLVSLWTKKLPQEHVQKCFKHV